jgi:hypothetical protein
MMCRAYPWNIGGNAMEDPPVIFAYEILNCRIELVVS